MTFTDKLVAVVCFLLSCTLVGLFWLGVVGLVNLFLDSPALAPYFGVGFFSYLLYVGVSAGSLWLWRRLPLKYHRERFDIWLFACIAPAVTIVVTTFVVLGTQGVLALLGACLIGLMFAIPSLLPFLAGILFFMVLTGLLDIDE